MRGRSGWIGGMGRLGGRAEEGAGCSLGRKAGDGERRGEEGRRGGGRWRLCRRAAGRRERGSAAGLVGLSIVMLMIRDLSADVPSPAIPICTTTFPCPNTLPSTLPSTLNPIPKNTATPTSSPVEVQFANPISHSNNQVVPALLLRFARPTPPDSRSADGRVPRLNTVGEAVERSTEGMSEVLAPREQMLRVI